MHPLSTLLVDADQALCGAAVAALEHEGCPVTVARSLRSARQALAGDRFELVVLGRQLPDGDGLGWLPELKAELPQAVVMLLTDPAGAVDAIRQGAADTLARPLEAAELMVKVRRASDELQLRERLERAERELSHRRRLLPSHNKVMRQVVTTLEKLARSPRLPLLLVGEPGVCFEQLAWRVHESAAGAAAPFVQVDCAALPEATAERELFGQESPTARGLIDAAAGGTLFFHEVAELSQPVQARLALLLESGTFHRPGGTGVRLSSARVIASTERDLLALVEAGEFREDLRIRFSAHKVRVPPLRERPEDVEELATALLAELRGGAKGRRRSSLAPAALERLKAYSFPGNERELRNLLERALLLEEGPLLQLPAIATGEAASGHPLEAAFVVRGRPISVDQLVTRYVRWVLERTDGKRMEAARTLDLSYPTFLKRLGAG